MGKRRPLAPIENDQLYSCPVGMPTSAIVTALNATDYPCIELSARHWDEFWWMRNDLLRAEGQTDPRWYSRPDQQPNWDSLNDLILTRSWDGRRFVGELVIIRDVPTPAPQNLLHLVDLMAGQSEYWSHQHVSTDRRILVVLEGWENSVLAGRWPRHDRFAYFVNFLRPTP
jgi:hypothetical protein